LGRLLLVALVAQLGQLQFKGLQALLQLHQSLGQDMGGLGQILCVACNAEGNGFGCHGWRAMMPMTAQFSSAAKVAVADSRGCARQQ
jgi:hypothetical protein